MRRCRSFKELSQSMRLGRDYIIEMRRGKSNIAIMAPHGGGIEPGTATIADAVAHGDHDYYAFKGIRSVNNRRLHIPSIYFDEPQAMEVIRRCHTVITLHGCKADGRIIYLGGRDSSLKQWVGARLIQSGHKVETPSNISLRGEHRHNLCNRGLRGKGLQLEISGPLRRCLSGKGGWHRRRPTPELQSFALAIRQGIRDAQEDGSFSGHPR